MVNTHQKIIEVMGGARRLADRIGEEYKGRITQEGIEKLYKIFLMVKGDRNSINSRHWRKIHKVSMADRAKLSGKELDNHILITYELLVDTQPRW